MTAPPSRGSQRTWGTVGRNIRTMSESYPKETPNSPRAFGQIRTAYVCPSPTLVMGVSWLCEYHLVMHQDTSTTFGIAHEVSREFIGIVPF